MLGKKAKRTAMCHIVVGYIETFLSKMYHIYNDGLKRLWHLETP